MRVYLVLGCEAALIDYINATKTILFQKRLNEVKC